MKSFVRDFLVPTFISLSIKSIKIFANVVVVSMKAVEDIINRYYKSELSNKIYLSGVFFFAICMYLVPNVIGTVAFISFAMFAVAFAIRLFNVFKKTTGKKILGVSVFAVVQVFLIPLSISSAIDKIIGLESSSFPITVALVSNIYYIYNSMLLLVYVSFSISALIFIMFLISLPTKKKIKGKYIMDYIGAICFAGYLAHGIDVWNNFEKKLEGPIKYIAIKTDFSQLSKYPVQLKGKKKVIHNNGYYTYYDEIENANPLWSSSYWRSFEETKFRTELIPMPEVSR